MEHFIIVYSGTDESLSSQFLSHSTPMESNLQNINGQTGGTQLHEYSVDGGIKSRSALLNIYN